MAYYKKVFEKIQHNCYVMLRLEIIIEEQPESISGEEWDEIPELLTDATPKENTFVFHYEPVTVSEKLLQQQLRAMNEMQKQVFFLLDSGATGCSGRKDLNRFFPFLNRRRRDREISCLKSHLLRSSENFVKVYNLSRFYH